MLARVRACTLLLACAARAARACAHAFHTWLPLMARPVVEPLQPLPLQALLVPGVGSLAK
jgi:hypothetical protein